MALLKILYHPHTVLRQKAEPVTEITDDVRTLLDDMADTMYDAPGIGLAAPQIGVSKRLVVIDVEGGREGQPKQPIKMINPEIIDVSEQMSIYDEGCLSLPGVNGEVERPESITFKYTDINGQEQIVSADGLLATCVQHEIDHLDGKLFIDYLSPLKRNMVVRKLKKILKDQERG